MKWIVVAIIAVIVPYTYLTLKYRQPGPTFEPYRDLKQQANLQRMRTAQIRRSPLQVEIPAEPARPLPGIHGPAATPAVSGGGLPEFLRAALIDVPTLPDSIGAVRAGGACSALLPYVVQFTCTLPDLKESVGEAMIYGHENELVLVPHFDRIQGELLARSREATVRLTVPAGWLQSGTYQVTLPGNRQSRTWTLVVK